MKIIVTKIPTNLVTNSLLHLFWPFLETKNKDQIFNQLVVRNGKYFCFLFIVNHALLQTHVEWYGIGFYKGIY